MRSEIHVVIRMIGGYGLDFIAPEHHADDDVLVGEAYVDGIALDAEIAASKLHLVA